MSRSVVILGFGHFSGAILTALLARHRRDYPRVVEVVVVARGQLLSVAAVFTLHQRREVVA